MLGADLTVWVWALVLLGGIALVFLILRHGRRRTGRLMPEALFVVSVDADQVEIVDPAGVRRSVAWRVLERLVIRTTDTGPLLPDVFWELESADGPILQFPGGATGENDFLLAAQTHLHGFRNDQVIAAMSSTSNREFVVWERDRDRLHGSTDQVAANN